MTLSSCKFVVVVDILAISQTKIISAQRPAGHRHEDGEDATGAATLRHRQGHLCLAQVRERQRHVALREGGHEQTLRRTLGDVRRAEAIEQDRQTNLRFQEYHEFLCE